MKISTFSATTAATLVFSVVVVHLALANPINVPGNINDYMPPEAHYNLPTGDFYVGQYHTDPIRWNQITYRAPAPYSGTKSIVPYTSGYELVQHVGNEVRVYSLDFAQVLFVTNLEYGIDDVADLPPSVQRFGDAAGADWQVMSAAYEAGLIQSWDGQTIDFKALISVDGANVIDRAALDDFGYINVAGQEIAPDLARLLSGNLDAPILTETGQLLTNEPVWTGALPNGDASINNAANWSDPYSSLAVVGTANGPGTTWLSDHVISSNSGAHLYGVSIDHFYLSGAYELAFSYVVPEPSTLALSAVGMGLVICLGVRRRKHSPRG